jgi:hypothetical protein
VIAWRYFELAASVLVYSCCCSVVSCGLGQWFITVVVLFYCGCSDSLKAAVPLLIAVCLLRGAVTYGCCVVPRPILAVGPFAKGVALYACCRTVCLGCRLILFAEGAAFYTVVGWSAVGAASYSCCRTVC